MIVFRNRVEPPWRVPDFTETREVGTGEHCRTVLATSTLTGNAVAIRYLPASLMIDQARAAALRSRIILLGNVIDPRVECLCRYEEDPRLHRPHRYVGAGAAAAIITDAVDGISARRLLDKGVTFPIQAALVLLGDSLRGLAAAHDAGLVHGDFRTNSILIHRAGHATVTGFAVAALTGGSPSARAPELWDGSPATPASDTYAAICAFVTLLTGRPPFDVAPLYRLMWRHRRAPIPVQHVPEEVWPLLTGMVKDPERRPPAEALVTELTRGAAEAYGPGWESEGLGLLSAAVAPVTGRAPAPASAPRAGRTDDRPPHAAVLPKGGRHRRPRFGGTAA